MRQQIDSILNELYPLQEARGGMYEKCLYFLADSEGLNKQCDYSFKLNMLLLSEREGRNDDAHAWGILTLCDLIDEISKAREGVLANSANLNIFDIDLKLALSLPGEKIECDEIFWSAFGFGDEEYVGGKAADITQFRKRLEKSIAVIQKNKNVGPLDEINRLSSIFGDVLSMLSRFSPRF